ncbi:MAG: hypothetical protein AAB676_16020 [Verrucomicrobiota bacterium]
MLNLIEEIREIVAGVAWTFREPQEVFEAEFERDKGTVGSEQNRERIIAARLKCVSIIAIWHEVLLR